MLLKLQKDYKSDMDQFRGETAGDYAPVNLPGFLTSFGLNLISNTTTRKYISTAATAAQDPFQTFQAAN